MMNRTAVLHLLVLTVCALAACETNKSANPLSPDVAGPIPGIAITAPKTLEPVMGQQVVSDGTPIVLLIENSGTTGPRELFLQVDVASDAGFQQFIHQANRVTPGPNGRTAYRMPEALGSGHTYYWRARSLDGANTGPYSSVSHFSVIEPVKIETPTPLEPLGNISTNRPTFVVRNGKVTGPAGDVVYRFEIGTTTNAPPAAVVTVTPGSGGTTSMSMGDLPYSRTLFWRVWATDGTTASPFSNIVSFQTPAPPPAPPTVVPPPAGGGGGGGTGTPGGSGGLPFAIPGSCSGAGTNGYACARAMADLSAEWRRCAGGDGVGCHRFTRQVVHALSRSDSNWRLIMAARGGHACSCSSCGPSDGSMFREDTAVYGGNRVFDMIVGAGGPSPSVGWSEVTGPRPGDTPASAAVCP